jgi:hypothetical protein
MRTHARSRALLRARLHADERGFGLVETLIAITVIFASLTALAYTATAGFGYIGLARDRQAADGIANQVMEQVRGLAYDKVTKGLSSTDLGGDSNIVGPCGTPSEYRFLSCSAGSTPGAGEKIVSSPGLTNVTPLVPHRSSTSPNTNPVSDGTTYTWSVYVTRDDSSTTAPYRVTVLVTWTGGAKAGATNKLVRVQSLFWSPTGCLSTATHPFAAPCQPSFFASTTLPQSTIVLAGSVDQTTVTGGTIYVPTGIASAQQEQVTQVQGSWQGAEVDLTDGSGTQSAGGTSDSTNADTDPATTPDEYDRIRCPTDVACATGAVSASSSGNSLTLTAPSSTGDSASTTSAGGGNLCPSFGSAEADSLPCSGTSVQQTGDLKAVLSLTHAGNIGTATLAQVKAASSASTTVVHRNANPNTNGCSPTSGADGCMGMSATRSLGTLNLGGLPSGFTAGTGWTGSNPWNGYFLSVVGYQDSLTAAVGTQSPLPAPSQSGTLYYYDGSGYTSLSVTHASVNALNASYTTTQSIGGTSYTFTVATDTSEMTAGSNSYTPTTPSGNQTRNEVTARVLPPTVKIHYQVTSPGTTHVDMTAEVLLGTLEANGSYAAAPAQGS